MNRVFGNKGSNRQPNESIDEKSKKNKAEKILEQKNLNATGVRTCFRKYVWPNKGIPGKSLLKKIRRQIESVRHGSDENELSVPKGFREKLGGVIEEAVEGGGSLEGILKKLKLELEKLLLSFRSIPRKNLSCIVFAMLVCLKVLIIAGVVLPFILTPLGGGVVVLLMVILLAVVLWVLIRSSGVRYHTWNFGCITLGLRPSVYDKTPYIYFRMNFEGSRKEKVPKSIGHAIEKFSNIFCERREQAKNGGLNLLLKSRIHLKGLFNKLCSS